MFGLFTIASVAFSVIAAVNGAAIPRDTVVVRSYDSANLEPYDDYHERYMDLDCEDKHNTSFFDDCCHPLLKGQTLAANRPAYCDPSNTSSSSSASAAAATPTDDDGDCDDGDDTPPPPPPAAPTPTPTPSAAPPPPKAAPPPPKAAPPPPAAPPAPPAPVNAAPPPPVSTPSNIFTGGHGTWFTQNGVAGACGTVHSDNDFIVALDSAKYGNTGATSPDCGKSVTITNLANNKQATAVVADACPTCENENCLDMSVALFQALAGDLGIGEIDINWHFD